MKVPKLHRDPQKPRLKRRCSMMFRTLQLVQVPPLVLSLITWYFNFKRKKYQFIKKFPNNKLTFENEIIFYGKCIYDDVMMKQVNVVKSSSNVHKTKARILASLNMLFNLQFCANEEQLRILSLL